MFWKEETVKHSKHINSSQQTTSSQETSGIHLTAEKRQLQSDNSYLFNVCSADFQVPREKKRYRNFPLSVLCLVPWVLFWHLGNLSCGLYLFRVSLLFLWLFEIMHKKRRRKDRLKYFEILLERAGKSWGNVIIPTEIMLSHVVFNGLSKPFTSP